MTWLYTSFMQKPSNRGTVFGNALKIQSMVGTSMYLDRERSDFCAALYESL